MLLFLPRESGRSDARVCSLKSARTPSAPGVRLRDVPIERVHPVLESICQIRQANHSNRAWYASVRTGAAPSAPRREGWRFAPGDNPATSCGAATRCEGASETASEEGSPKRTGRCLTWRAAREGHPLRNAITGLDDHARALLGGDRERAVGRSPCGGSAGDRNREPAHYRRHQTESRGGPCEARARSPSSCTEAVGKG